MTVLLNPAPVWDKPRCDELTLRHGCTNSDWLSIRKKIDLAKCNPDSDFGRGFYTTTIKRQARQWAWIRYYDNPSTGNYPVILEFRLDRDELGRLCSLAFVVGDYHSLDYWSFVQHCRQSSSNGYWNHSRTGPNGWYDLVSGPVAADWRQRVCLDDADQFSFHTDAAAALLEELIKSGDPSRFRSEAVM
jgi:uncharacterized protein DUF3990